MSKFIIVPVFGKEDKALEDLRVSIDSILKYRRWLNKDNRAQTVVFFKKPNEGKLIVDLHVEDLDKSIKECK